jgi:drug/metabolite transporter (DMT)-like permease
MKRLAILALILSGVFWGLGFPLGKLALREMEAAHMVLWRFAVAAAAALPFALARPDARALYRSPSCCSPGCSTAWPSWCSSRGWRGSASAWPP